MAEQITFTNGAYEYTSDGARKVFQLHRSGGPIHAMPNVGIHVSAKIDDTMSYVEVGAERVYGTLDVIFIVDIPADMKVRIQSELDVLSGMMADAE